jgi:hypothetical protein
MAAGVSREEVANTISTVIHEQAVVPLQYNVPLHEVAEVWKLPRVGDVLRVPRTVETPLSSVANLSKEGFYTIASSDGQDDFSFNYGEYTIYEQALYTVINKWAPYTSPMDLARIAGNRLINAAARIMNRNAYHEACGALDSDINTLYGAGTCSGGFQWLRADGANTSATGDLMGLVVGSSPTTISVACATLTEADNFWRYGQITFTSGKCAGLSRRITAFADTGDTVTFDALPVAPTAGDTFNITVLGNGVISDDLGSGDTITLPMLYKAHERCRRYGAGAAQMTGPMLDVAGIARDRSGMIPQGIAFVPTAIAHDLRVATAGTAANTNNFWMTEAAVQRAFGGNLGKIGGLLIAEVNHNVRTNVTDGTFSLTAGLAWPTLVMYETGFGCTTLSSPGTGDKQGLNITTKIPSPSDIAVKYKSIKMQVEMDIINRYFVLNSLRGCVLWTGTSTA